MLVHWRVIPQHHFAGTYLSTWVERGTMRVKCLFREHNWGFQNKAATAGDLPASWLYVTRNSGHSNNLATNKLACHSCLLFQLLMPTSKHFETSDTTQWPWLGLQPRPSNLDSSMLVIGPLHLPHLLTTDGSSFWMSWSNDQRMNL